MATITPPQPAASEKALHATEALEKLLADYSFQTVLDVGCGFGRHARRMQAAGKDVTLIDIVGLTEDVVVANYLEHEFGREFDCVWVSHVLEHQLNVNLFLRKVYRDLREGGILAVSVPPLKHAIVGGHLTLWNAGLLLYNLILAGFDCSQARIKQYGYNISILTPKIPAQIPYGELHYDTGDIEILAPFFPQHPALPIQQSFPGNIRQLRWHADELEMNLRKTVGTRLRKLLTGGYWLPKLMAW